MSQVVAISDLHADIRENREWLHTLCDGDHRDEILLLAGDVASDPECVAQVLEALVDAFEFVFFVPGNHDLWVSSEESANSVQRLEVLRALCERLGVLTEPTVVQDHEGRNAAVIVPLLSWYAEPEESPDSLFLPKQGEDGSLSMWADRQRIRWPDYVTHPARFFLEQNEPLLITSQALPTISFSHFLPRRELIFSSTTEKARFGRQGGDRAPRFNFSRVAGTAGLERQIRRLNSLVHVHGHQHRNRDRVIDGVRYVSHCLGYPQERRDAGVNTAEVYPAEVFRF
ncbi:MAG: hypothetical protein M2R45_00853 [Verrucomicrobia subdivision 3 bacterium]|nr:hypothetical protein [Limisphaerales bacterium]MCS1413041.1 hypothetical protein [Limisphaerales bacterium]